MNDTILKLLRSTKVWLTFQDIADNTGFELEDVEHACRTMYVDRSVAIQGEHVAVAHEHVKDWMYS